MYIITGTSRGIGKYLLEELGGYGLQRNEANDRISKDHTFFVCDITKQEDIDFFIDQNRKNFVNVVLINCAGINYNSFAHKSNSFEWEKVIKTNLIGTFNLIRALLPIMREQKYGRIINLSSVVGKIGVMGTSAYAASKSALTGMVKSIAVENAGYGITINNINLGYFNIGMIDEIPLSVKEFIKEKIPCKSFGEPENILNAIHFIVKSNYVNGASIDINGGLA